VASINVLADLETEPITRQDLFDMWNTGALTDIPASDFADDFLPIQNGSSFSDFPQTPAPGQLVWHLSENVMFCWTDEVDGTGVSLWLAMGPDKFETALYAEEPIGAALPVELVFDRVARLATPVNRSMPRAIGFNQSGINSPVGVNNGPDTAPSEVYGGDTTSSGSWFRCGVDGLLYGKIDDAENHPTQAAMQITQISTLTIEVDPTLPMGLKQAEIFSLPNSAREAPHGMTTQWVQTPAGQTVTEPSYIFKFFYAPRINGQGFFQG